MSEWWYLLVTVVVVVVGLLLLRRQRQRAQAHRRNNLTAAHAERDYAGDRERARSEGLSTDDRAWELASQQKEREHVARDEGARHDRGD